MNVRLLCNKYLLFFHGKLDRKYSYKLYNIIKIQNPWCLMGEASGRSS